MHDQAQGNKVTRGCLHSMIEVSVATQVQRPKCHNYMFDRTIFIGHINNMQKCTNTNGNSARTDVHGSVRARIDDRRVHTKYIYIKTSE